MATTASIEVPATHDLNQIIVAAGADVTDGVYEGGRLYVQGVTQAKLNAALNAYDPSKPVYVPVPVSVTRAQAKIALFRAGLLDQVKVLVDEAGGEIEIWFTEAGLWERNNPHVADLAASLKLTSEKVDELFVIASQISA